MATVNGIISNEKSMSGVVESPIGDIIECTTLIADSVESQNIYAQDGLVDCSLFNNDYATVTLGNSATNLINLGAFQFLIDTIRHITSTLNLYLFPTTTGVINFATSASQILFGSSTALTSAFVPTANNHLTNKQYVDSVVGSNLIPLNNTWTGLNTFASTALTQNMVLDSQTTSVSEIKFRTNTADPTMNTCRIRAASGTIVDRGRLSFFASGLESFTTNLIFWSTASNQSMLIDPSTTTGSVFVNFRTSSSPSSTGVITASITGSGGTTANTGTITMTGANLTMTSSNTTFNSSSNTQSVKINASTSGSASVDYYTYTTNNTVRTASITTTGGTATALSGTMEIDAKILLMSAITTSFPVSSNISLYSVNSPYLFFDSSNKTTVISGATTISNTNVYDMLYIVPYSNGTQFNITLKGVATDVNSGNVFRIFNNGSVQVTITTSNSTSRLVGSAVSRNGVSLYTLASNACVRIQTVVAGSNPFNQTAANAGAYLLTLA